MSMFNKLKAIRARSGGEAEEAESKLAAPAEDSKDGSVIQAASMWDLVADTEEETPIKEEMAAQTAPQETMQPDPAPAAEAAPAPAEVAAAPAKEDVTPEPEQPQPATAKTDQEVLAAVVTPIPVAKKPEAEAKPQDAQPKQRRSGRVKTRLIGFDRSNGDMVDIADIEKKTATAAPARGPLFPVGWMVVTDGPGRGETFSLSAGVSQIGREEGQAIQLDFGDNSISRSNHASIAFDDEQQSFYIGHGGKSNLVRLNGKPLLSTETLSNGDEVRIGETTLRLVALCGADFTWKNETENA